MRTACGSRALGRREARNLAEGPELAALGEAVRGRRGSRSRAAGARGGIPWAAG
jgi:hypothetical protein